MHSEAKIYFIPQTKNLFCDAKARLKACEQVAPQASLVAAGGVEIDHAAANRVRGVIRAFVGIRRLAPPMTTKIRAIEVRRQDNVRTEHEGVGKRSAHATAVKEIVAKWILARVGAKLVLT